MRQGVEPSEPAAEGEEFSDISPLVAKARENDLIDSRSPARLHTWTARNPPSLSRLMTVLALTDGAAKPELLKAVAAPNGGSALLDAQLAIRDAAWRRTLSNEYDAEQLVPPERIKVLDPFAGGGSEALEAARLGCEVHAGDIQPSAFHILRATTQFPQNLRARNSRRSPLFQLEKWGRFINDRVKTLLTSKLPDYCEATGPALWCNTLRGESCGHEFRQVAYRKGCITVTVQNEEPILTLDDSKPESRGRRAVCPLCKCGQSVVSTKRWILLGFPQQKGTFTLAEAQPPIFEDPALSGDPLPDTYRHLKTYGLETFADLFSPRQKAILLAYVDAIGAALNEIESESEEERASLRTYLAFFLGHVAERNSILSRWDHSKGTYPAAFNGFMPMAPRAFLEPTLDSLLKGWLERLKPIEELCRVKAVHEVGRWDASALPHPANTFDAIITTPPIFNEVDYGAAASFCWFWESRFLAAITPDFQCKVGPLERSGPHSASQDEYLENFAAVLFECCRVLKPGGKLALRWSESQLWSLELLTRDAEAAGLQLTNIVRVTPDFVSGSDGGRRSELMVFLRKPKGGGTSLSVQANALLESVIADGPGIGYQALAQLIVDRAEPEDLADYRPHNARGTPVEVLMEVLADQHPIEVLEKLFGRAGIRDIAKGLGVTEGQGSPGERLLAHFGFVVGQKSAANGPHQVLQQISRALARARQTRDKEELLGLTTAQLIAVESLLKTGVFAWARLAFGAEWKSQLAGLLANVPERSPAPLGKLTFGQIVRLFGELPQHIQACSPCFSTFQQKFGTQKAYPLKKPKKLVGILGEVVGIRNKLLHNKEGYYEEQEPEELRSEVVKTLTMLESLIPDLKECRAIPAIAEPHLEIRDRLGRLFYRMLLDDATEYEIASSQSLDLHKTYLLFKGLTNPRPIDPLLLEHEELTI